MKKPLGHMLPLRLQGSLDNPSMFAVAREGPPLPVTGVTPGTAGKAEHGHSAPQVIQRAYRPFLCSQSQVDTDL